MLRLFDDDYLEKRAYNQTTQCSDFLFDLNLRIAFVSLRLNLGVACSFSRYASTSSWPWRNGRRQHNCVYQADIGNRSSGASDTGISAQKFRPCCRGSSTRRRKPDLPAVDEWSRWQHWAKCQELRRISAQAISQRWRQIQSVDCGWPVCIIYSPRRICNWKTSVNFKLLLQWTRAVSQHYVATY